MKKAIDWTGIAHQSTEHCVIETGPEGTSVYSVIQGRSEKGPFRVDYNVQINARWETQSARIQIALDDRTKDWTLIKTAASWLVNQAAAPEFSDCFDIDISLTPFTNTLPIRRLKFKDHSAVEIEVIYFDILAGEIKPVKQCYTKQSDAQYLYENGDRMFSAELTTDLSGLVTHYPGLFIMNRAG